MQHPYKTPLWKIFLRNILTSKINIFALSIVCISCLIALCAATGILANQWDVSISDSHTPPSLQHICGTDILGRSVLDKLIKGTEVAMSTGFFVATLSIIIGVVLGVLAGYFGGIVDTCVVWLYSTITSIPNIMLLLSLTFILGKGIVAIYISLGVTMWVGICRLIRGEVIKHKNREYILAASAIGASHFRKLWYHLLPNIWHIIIIQFALIFQVAIKSEVMLSYLGLGIQNSPSWGTMIDEAKTELIRGIWWPFTFATLAMFLIVLAFNLLSDTLRDTLDPKLKKK